MDEETLFNIIKFYNAITKENNDFINVTDLYVLSELNSFNIENDIISLNGKYKYRDENSSIFTDISLYIKPSNDIEIIKDEKVVSTPSIIISGNEFKSDISYNTSIINTNLNGNIIMFGKDGSISKFYNSIDDMYDGCKKSSFIDNDLKNSINEICNTIREDIRKLDSSKRL